MPVKYIPYYPETVEGQSILNNFVRSRRALKYRDNDKVFTRVKKGLPFYEVEQIETVGGTSKNMLIRGECISACAYLKEKGIKVDMAYIDPPFASGADYAKRVFIRRNPKVAEAIANAESELSIDELKSFELKMYGDIWSKEAYLNWMYENLLAIKSVLTETGIIWVHLDHSIGFYVKILLDEVFGEDNWLNTITWRSQVARGKKVDAFYYPYSSHYLMIYSKNKNPELNVWNIEKKELKISAEDAESDYYKDKDGYFRTSDPGSYSYDKLVEFHRVNRIYVSKGGKLIIDEENRKVKTTKGSIGIKYYLRKVGDYYIADRAIDNIWDDVPGLGTVPSEDVGYATQKTTALLKRVINASTNEFRNEKTKERMVVADFFGGSGVTAEVANELGRNFIHVDVGINSIQTAGDRLKANKASFNVFDIQDGVNLFRNPVQTMDKLKKMILGLRNEDKLDKFWEGAIQDSKLGLIPVYLPNLIDHSTKVLDIPLMNRVINEAIPDLPDSVKKIIVYFIDIDDKKEIEKFIREQNILVEVELRDLKQILDDVIVDDIVEYKLKEKSDTYEIEITKFISDRLIQKIDEFNQKGSMQPDLLNGNDDANVNDSSEESGEENNNSKKNFSPIKISKNGLELIELIGFDCKSKTGVWHSDKEIKIAPDGYVVEDGKKSKTFWNAKVVCNKKPVRMKIRNIAGDETIINITMK